MKNIEVSIYICCCCIIHTPMCMAVNTCVWLLLYPIHTHTHPPVNAQTPVVIGIAPTIHTFLHPYPLFWGGVMGNHVWHMDLHRVYGGVYVVLLCVSCE